NHLIGGGEQLVRHSEAEHPSGLVIDDELELARLHDRQVRGLRALEDAAGVDTQLAKHIRNVGSVTHEAASCRKVTRTRCQGNGMARRHVGKLHPPADEKSILANEEGVRPLAPKSCEGCIDLRLVLALSTWSCNPMARAADCTSLNVASVLVALAGLTSTAIRATAGTSSRRSFSRFAVNSALKKLMPVGWPPGRARLATRPSLAGSSGTPKTRGIVAVAALAANAAVGLPAVTITATCRRTNSAARADSRSI